MDEAVFLSEKILVLTGKPVDTIKEYEVPLPKERTREMLYDKKAEELKEELLSVLRKEAEQ